MKKIAISIAAIAVACSTAYAGGYVTNTNQSISFLRQPAQNASISVNGAYFNPAGTGFLPKGWQLSFGWQTVNQERRIESTFAPFALGADNNGNSTKNFKALTKVPFLPSLDATWTGGKFFGSFHFGIVAGGGAAPFEDGLGSIESKIALMPVAVKLLSGGRVDANSYSADIYMKGEQYDFSGQLNFGYKITDWLNIAIGGRFYYIDNKYKAHIKDVKIGVGGTMLPATTVAQNLGLSEAQAQGLAGDKELDCKQTDFSFAPIASLAFNYKNWRASARYEFRTSVKAENDTKKNNIGMAQYEDGFIYTSDIPALLALGVGYEILPNLRVDANFNYYFDKQSKSYNSLTGKNDKNDMLDHNTYEILAGIEWDITKHWTVSAGGQMTRFGFDKDLNYLSDTSFSISSETAGLGLRYKVNRHLSFELAGFYTFYQKLSKSYEDYNGNVEYFATALGQPGLKDALKANGVDFSGKDVFHRKSLTIGLGVNYAF